MKSNRRRWLLIAAGIFIFLCIAVFFGYLYVLSRIKSRVIEQLHALRDSGYIVGYDSIVVDSKKNEVIIHKLVIKRSLDTTFCATSDFVTAKSISARGFELIPLILKKQLVFKAIDVDSPKVIVHKNFFEKTARKPDRKEFTIKIQHLSLPGLRFELLDSSTCEPALRYRSNHSIDNFVLSLYKDRDAYFNITSFQTDSMSVDFRDEFYTVKIGAIRLDLNERIFKLDTLRLIPHYPKLEFGRKAGKETDRIEAMIPYLNLYGVKVHRQDSLSIVASKLTTQLFIKAFRDKRLPFKNNYKPLPVEALFNLSFGLKIDSVVLNKSYVEYEEIGIDADSSGTVFFDNLYATVQNFNNTQNTGEALLVAEADLMGEGKLHVAGTCPYDLDKNYKVNGYLKDMDLRKFNDMLEPEVKTRIESGHLNMLTFGFGYNNSVSNGELKLDYNDLKIMTFRNENRVMKIVHKKRMKGEEVDLDEELGKKSALKTFIVNTFILRRNMDGNVPEQQRTGEINFHREKRKSVFNFWAKSMLSGIKSAFNIDKIEDSKIKKMVDKKSKD
jgi:hypothetical protein